VTGLRSGCYADPAQHVSAQSLDVSTRLAEQRQRAVARLIQDADEQVIQVSDR
jgi:hypothetical protein